MVKLKKLKIIIKTRVTIAKSFNYFTPSGTKPEILYANLLKQKIKNRD